MLTFHFYPCIENGAQKFYAPQKISDQKMSANIDVDWQSFAHRAAVEYQRCFDEPFCGNGTELQRGAGRPTARSLQQSGDEPILVAIQLLQVHPRYYSASHAAVFLLLYKRLLIYYSWRYRNCRDFASYYALEPRKRADVAKIGDVVIGWKRSVEQLPRASDCSLSVSLYFVDLLKKSLDNATFDPVAALRHPQTIGSLPPSFSLPPSSTASLTALSTTSVAAFSTSSLAPFVATTVASATTVATIVTNATSAAATVDSANTVKKRKKQ